MKLNLKVNDRVEIKNTGTDIDGHTGKNLGKATENIIDFYIILLDEPIPNHLAVIFPEGCLVLL
jgi:hypothetical protein